MKKDEVIDSLRVLHDLSKTINSTLNIDEVVDGITEKTAAVTGCDKVLILLLNRDENILRLYSSRGFAEGEVLPKEIDNVLSFDHCLVHKGTVISLREIVSGEDYYRYIKGSPFLADMVFAPLEIKGEASGLLGVVDDRESFSDIELEIFCALGSQAAVAMENANIYRRLKDAFLHTAEALAEAVNSRDPYTGGHTKRVKEYSIMIASSTDMPLEELETLKLAATLHDIGKIGIDDAILRKGGVLTEEEELLMKRHPEIGAKILAYVDEMEDMIPGVYCHHERIDGKGYPEGLKGEEIPLIARVIAVADAFDALTTDRPYRLAIDKDTACEELRKAGGTQLDPALVKAFCDSIPACKSRMQTGG